MTKLRSALLAAVTLAGIPAMGTAQVPPAQQAEPQSRHQPGEHGDHGDRGGGHDHGDRGGAHDHGGQSGPAGGGAPANPPPSQPAPGPNRWGPNAPGGQGGYAGREPVASSGDRWGPRAPGGQGGYAGRGPNDPNGNRWGPNAPGGQGGYVGRGPDGPGRDHWGQGGPGAPRPDGWRNNPRYDWRGWRDRNRALFRAPHYVPPRAYGYGYRPFSPGFRLQPFFYDRSYWIDDPFSYRLPPAYGPYRWVRYYNDVLLVDLRSGEVVDVIRDFFW